MNHHCKKVPTDTNLLKSPSQTNKLESNGKLTGPNTTPRPPVSSFTPSQIRTAYNVPSNYDGTGITIAIIDACPTASYSQSKIASDYNTFCTQFDLPTTGLSIYTYPPTGGTIPTNTNGWGDEICLDIQWTHAIAPKANIILILSQNTRTAQAASSTNLAGAINLAISKGADIVSMSWGSGEVRTELSSTLENIFSAQSSRQITFLASIGDVGGVVSYPGCSPNVIGVGGTTLGYNITTNTYLCESAWYGSGGGTSKYIQAPIYQTNSNVALVSQNRQTPDVGFLADPYTGVAVFSSESLSSGEWIQVGGTSLGAPAWAGITALIYQKFGKLGTKKMLTSLYNIYSSDSYRTCFNDITIGESMIASGVNIVVKNKCNIGYDLISGIGTPNVANLLSSTFFN